MTTSKVASASRVILAGSRVTKEDDPTEAEGNKFCPCKLFVSLANLSLFQDECYAKFLTKTYFVEYI